MHDLIIREAVLTDIPTIQSLATIIWADAYGEVLSTNQIAYMQDKSYSESRISEQIKTGEPFFMVEYDGKAIGFMGLAHANNTGKIDKLYLLPQQHRKGIGRTCINFCSDYFRKLGCDKMYLHVNRYNRAVLFYLAVGFKIERVYDYAYGEGYWMNDYIMVKGI